jgi:hypothetical protein
MPWSQLSPIDQKTQFIADYLRRSLSVTELCEPLWHQPQDRLQVE